MIANLTKPRGSLIALAVGAALAAGSPALAQPFSPAPGANVSGVTVYAGRLYARQPTTGRIVRLDHVSTTVSLADLDLNTRWGAREAKRRIEVAARDVCDRADDVYPRDGQIPGGCRAAAVRNALRQAQDETGYPILAWGYR